ncbi:unnamed protein product [Rotaria socialis]|uniref:Hydantoinase n=2 Tax=Rotaria socialis TaxID=392032 RepID=A0A817YA40_9BILA|nr:unnamed protein product [Rotaria socialis]CAF4628812.1 unnamed protein product [Rotaria socialis]
MVGTTHFINALIQRQSLTRVCTLRLCGPATHSLRPMSNWPDDLKIQVDGLTALVSGGYFFDGSPIAPLDEEEIRSLVRQALTSDINSFCVCGVFSPCRPDQEERVAEIIREESSDAFITVSHEIAGLGLIERENVSILNACLRPLALRTMKALEKAIPDGIPVFLTQNNGTLLSIDQCIRFPVLTFASGSTNSMIGAAHLTGIQNGIVIDVGGTSTDIGVIVNGRPRHTHAKVYLVDDIRVNMSMPDVLSLPLGGGTVIHVDKETGSVCVGPDSVGYQLVTQALAFGGEIITGTDVALAAKLTSQIGHSTVQLPSFIVDQVIDHIKNTISRGIDRMKTNEEPIPVILCGGGSILLNPKQTFDGVTQMIRPPHYSVCNAVGAALCRVSATVESIVDLVPSSIDDGVQRKHEIDRLTLLVQQQCEQKGAHPNTIHLVDIEQVPLAYYPGGYKHRVFLTAIGQLDLFKLRGHHQQSGEQQLLPEVPLGKPQSSKPSKYMNMVNKQPTFDEHGFWIIDSIDIEYIAYGVGILGCGGGGEPYHTKLSCLEMLKNCNGVMRVISPFSLHPSLDLVASIGFMGAPTVSYEQLPSGMECLLAIGRVEEYLSRKVTAVFCGEIGGANGLRGLLVAASKQVPCVDCDNMGRAFPRLDQKLSFIRGQSVTPTCLCSVHGRTVLYTKETIGNAQQLEETLRKECTKMGLRGGLCLPPQTADEVQKYTVHHSLSLAWFLGKAKFSHHTNAIQAVAEAGNGRIIVSDGKVVGVERNTSSGFVRGHVIIDVEGRMLIIDFQNENLVARFEDKEVLASVPDLITLVEQDSGEPFSTETVKYGCRVSVLVLPAPEPMVTQEALKYVGPSAFGYDHCYIRPSYHVPVKSVWDMYYNKPSILSNTSLINDNSN